MDVTNPLPFERSTPYSQEVPMAEGEGTSSDVFADYANKDNYNTDDFKVDPVPTHMQLSESIMSQIASLPEEGEIGFGSNNEETMEHLKDPAMADGTDTSVPQQLEESSTGGGGGMVMPEELYGNTRGQVDWFISQQGSNKPESAPDSAGGNQAAEQSSAPPAMKVLEPLTGWDRLYYMKEQMMEAIKKKWEENKVKYIGIGAAVVLGVTALAIATGSAIFSLIPPALQIFAAIMAGAALLKAGGFFKKYLTEGWAGKFTEGGAALARAIGILLVELIFILLFDMAALLKVMKAGVKGSLKMAAAGVKNTTKALFNAGKATGKGLLKTGTKVVTGIKGIGKSVGKGAKNLDDLAKRMLKKARFKGFKIKRKGKRFDLYGKVNPLVWLGSGEIKKFDKNQIVDPGKARVGGDIKIINPDGTQSAAKLITKSDDLPKGAYKKIYEMATGSTSKGKVIHHMIEQQTMKMSSKITEAFINNSKRLKAFPQGVVNETVHLSKGGIRGMWDEFYKVALPLLDTARLTDQQFIDALMHFSKHTDDFIESTLKNIGSGTTKEGIQTIMETWQKQNETSKAILDALR